jgi:hypothetical protein
LVSFGERSSTEGNEGNEGEEADLKSADSFLTVTFISFARRGTGTMRLAILWFPGSWPLAGRRVVTQLPSPSPGIVPELCPEDSVLPDLLIAQGVETFKRDT